MANANSMKEVFCENLQNILSADKNVRELAEQQLFMLETNEEFGLHLMEISLSEKIDFSIRHLASVLLDRYITKHWSETSNNFQAPVVNATIKPLIREYLLKSITITSSNGSSQPTSVGEEFSHETKKLINSFAHSLSNIAREDWPLNWPELFPVLVGYLRSGSPTAIYSSLKVFKELTQEIYDIQIPNVAPILLPEMLNIIYDSGQSARSRSNAVGIFVSISKTIMYMNEYQRDSIKQHLAPHIPRFAEAVIGILMQSNCSPGLDIGLKEDIINGLTAFVKLSKKYFKVYLPKIMELIWQSLTTSANIYVQRVVNCDSFDLLGDNDEYFSTRTDSDGKSISFDSYIYSIIDFVTTIFESSKFRELIKPVLPDLLYYIMFYIQMTDEQVQIWQSDLDRFLEDDDLESMSYSVRIAAQYLIVNLSDEMTTTSESSKSKDDELFKIAFLEAIKRHFAQASEIEKQNKMQWWKIVESCLYSLGLIAPTIIWTMKSNNTLSNEYKAILDTILSNTTHLQQPFLAGRSIWTASRFSPIMNDQSLDNFLKLTASLLLMVDHPILRIYALRATYYFCENVSDNQKASVIKPHLPQFLEGLVSMGMQSDSSDKLDLVLQTILMLLEVDNEFTITVASSICTLTTSAFLQYPDNSSIFEVVMDLYDKLLCIESCHHLVQDRILPTIISILQASNQSNSSAQIVFKDAELRGGSKTISNILSLQPDALDMLAKLVQHAPSPIADVLIQQAYPTLISCLLNASKEDTAILQNGSECIRQYVAKASDQLISYIDPGTNQNGIVLALNMCNNLLSPQIPESCSTYIGRLIVTLIMKANQVVGHENIQHLLKSTLVKLNASNDLILTQGLIVVFAHLLYININSILMFLNSLPAPDGTKSALEFVLDRWLSIQLYFSGYENKASTVALCRLFQHSLINLDDQAVPNDLSMINLHRIEVTCDDMVSYLNENNSNPYQMESAARTRSKDDVKNKPSRKVPATVKILKLLLNEYNHLQEVKEAKNVKYSDVESDDDDSDDEDSGVHENNQCGGDSIQANSKRSEIIDLTDLLLEDGEDADIDADEVLSEEIAAIDLEDALRQVLCNFKLIPFAREFVSHLTASERQLLDGL